MRIVSWNSQGNKDYYYGILLNLYNPHVLCLQECGNIQEGVHEQVNGVPGSLLHFVKRFGRSNREVYYWPADADNCRCSMAIIINDVPHDGLVHTLSSWSPRPAMTIKIGRVWVSNIHAVASAGAAANDESFINQLVSRGYNGVCVGDFNCEPAVLRTRKLKAGASVISPGVSTHYGGGGNKILDYACLINYSKMGAGCHVHDNNYGSDHFSVVTDII